ncbi:MAG: TetR/AcrR family transcriptional regulator [Agitococcus sp.]
MARSDTMQATQRPRQRVSPVQERSRQKLNTILDATANLLVQQGVEATTMLAIAEAADLSPATVYHYFENRLAIFAALAERTMTMVDNNLSERLTAFAVSNEQSTHELLQTLYQLYHQTPGYVSLLTALRAEPSLQALVRESNRRIADVICEVLVRRTSLALRRAQRLGWILSQSCDQVLQEALLSMPEEAQALLEELTEMVDTLLVHYIQNSKNSALN